MAPTTYSTLSLPEPVAPKQSVVKYAILGLVAVAMVAAAGVLATSIAHQSTAVDVMTVAFPDAFAATAGDVPSCDRSSEDYLEKLPKYDAEHSTDTAEFYNACYFSYRCCSTTGNSDGCYVSDNFGPKCRGCLAENGPRMIRKTCMDWLYYYGPGAGEEEPGIEWTENDMINDNGFPSTLVPDFHLKFQTYKDKTCWVQAGSADRRMEPFVDKCFEVISWCNLLCPRATPKTSDHKMCKQCTLFGYDNKDTGAGF